VVVDFFFFMECFLEADDNKPGMAFVKVNDRNNSGKYSFLNTNTVV